MSISDTMYCYYCSTDTDTDTDTESEGDAFVTSNAQVLKTLPKLIRIKPHPKKEGRARTARSYQSINSNTNEGGIKNAWREKLLRISNIASFFMRDWLYCLTCNHRTFTPYWGWCLTSTGGMVASLRAQGGNELCITCWRSSRNHKLHFTQKCIPRIILHPRPITHSIGECFLPQSRIIHISPLYCAFITRRSDSPLCEYFWVCPLASRELLWAWECLWYRKFQWILLCWKAD